MAYEDVIDALPVVCFYWIVPNSRSFSIVIVQQPTESFPSD